MSEKKNQPTLEDHISYMKEKGLLVEEAKKDEPKHKDTEISRSVSKEEKYSKKEEKSPEREDSKEDKMGGAFPGEGGFPDEEPKEDFSDIEKEALALGWKPSGPKTAKEFIDDKPFYDEISRRGKEIKELKAALKELAENLKAKEDREKVAELQKIESARKEAIKKGDVEAVEKYDKQLFTPQPEPKQTVDPEITKHVDQFKQRNSEWWNDPSAEGRKMREYALKRDLEIKEDAPDLPLVEHFKILESDMRKEFSHRFNSPEREQIQAVDRDVSRTPASKPRSKDFRDLTEPMKAVARQMERLGIMTKEEYVKELEKSGVI